MSATEKYYPKEVNLGLDCQYWCLGGLATGCCFPKAELEGRRSCEGTIDDVCLLIKDGRQPGSLTELQTIEIKTRVPNSSLLPPGDIV